MAMRNTLYALVAATTFGMATPALAEYKVGDKMPDYIAETKHIAGKDRAWTFPHLGDACHGTTKGYRDSDFNLKFVVEFSNKEGTGLPFVILTGPNEALVDNKNKDGSFGSDGFIDEVVTDPHTSIPLLHPYCNQK